VKPLLALVAIAVATPAVAGPWIDDRGRSTAMQFPGVRPVTLAANGHTAAAGVAAFDAVCLKTAFDRSAVETAAQQSGWGFVYRAEMVPSNQPVDVGGWNAPDATVRMADGIFFNRKPQCNLTFVPAAEGGLGAVQEALASLLGKPADNADEQFDRKGKPKRYFAPEWTLAQPDGSNLKIFALSPPDIPGAIQLAVLKD
jgi:hypothetical protein